jgi:hypothetical protein
MLPLFFGVGVEMKCSECKHCEVSRLSELTRCWFVLPHWAEEYSYSSVISKPDDDVCCECFEAK